MHFLPYGCLPFSDCHLKNGQGVSKGAGFPKANQGLYRDFFNVVFKLN